MHDFVMIAAAAGDRLGADPPFWPLCLPLFRAGVFFCD